jgi:hypothetical protein
MSTPPYKYAIEDCQVDDKTALEKFRSKRREWLDWLKYDECHAISLSVSSIIWNDVSFRTLAQAGEMNEGGALGNSLIVEALINGHFAVQTLAIRRLMDCKKNVISLKKLLDDIATSIKLFTRENFVAFDGLPYDYEAAKKRVMAEQSSANNGPFWAAQSGPDAWCPAQQAHKMFDLLSGVDAGSRQRQDHIPKKHVETLQRWLEESDARSIVNWTHKFLAHAADRNSRARFDLTLIQPTLDKITAVSRTFVRVSEVVLAYLLFDSGHVAVMPVPQFNQFEKLSVQVIAKDQVSDLRSRWDAMTKERNDFPSGVIEDMLR